MLWGPWQDLNMMQDIEREMRVERDLYGHLVGAEWDELLAAQQAARDELIHYLNADISVALDRLSRARRIFQIRGVNIVRFTYLL